MAKSEEYVHAEEMAKICTARAVKKGEETHEEKYARRRNGEETHCACRRNGEEMHCARREELSTESINGIENMAV